MSTSDDWLHATPDGVALSVRIIPRAGATRIAGLRSGRLLVRLAAPPVGGAANAALMSLLGTLLDIPTRHIAIRSGARTRDKQIVISGIDAPRVRSAVSRFLERS